MCCSAVNSGTKTRRLLVIVLWLVGLHSIGFGLSLIILPCSLISLFGFTLSEKFFATQGGVFHLIVSYAYIKAALDPGSSHDLVVLACITKFSATLFLFSYYFFGKNIPMVLLSGILDCLMGIAILVTYMLYLRAVRNEKTALNP